MKKIGFTIGKFAPLHKGHQFLIEKALKEMDEFYIIVYETNLINNDIKQRASWIKTLYPKVKILYAYNPPSKYGLDEESIKIQINYLKSIIKDIPVTHFYSSEKYGKFVAKYMNVIDVRVDQERKIVPISATKIRKNTEENRNFLEDIVYYDIEKQGEKYK